jgi:hypothetical protein
MNTPISNPPSIEDACDALIEMLRKPEAYRLTDGKYDVLIQTVCSHYAGMAGIRLDQSNTQAVTEPLSRVFQEAAWTLCRLGVLRPGFRMESFGQNGDMRGYAITEFGRKWIAEDEHPAFVPTDQSRLIDLLTKDAALFGPVYMLRANDAARCYSAHAYYACCAMIGAAAESIMLSAGISKLTEQVALTVYRANAGRHALIEKILKGCPPYVARDFRLHADLINLWRDESAHAHDAAIGEAEAFTSMRGLIKFAHFAADRWKHLTAKTP